MKISFDPTKYSITARLKGRKFYAELSDFPKNLAPLVLDEVRLYDSSDYGLWVSKDRPRVDNQAEASGQTFEPKLGDFEVIGNHSYVMWELGEWAKWQPNPPA